MNMYLVVEYSKNTQHLH